jgi:hypothetical protein
MNGELSVDSEKPERKGSSYTSRGRDGDFRPRTAHLIAAYGKCSRGD